MESVFDTMGTDEIESNYFRFQTRDKESGMSMNELESSEEEEDSEEENYFDP